MSRPITVRTRLGLAIELVIEPETTIQQIKELIEKDYGLLPARQLLFLNGIQVDGDPTRIAQDCDIFKRTVLDLMEKPFQPPNAKTAPSPMRVEVYLPSGRMVPLDILPHYTIRKIKEMLIERLGSPFSLEVLFVEVFFSGGRAMELHETAAALNIKDGAEIMCDPCLL